jgi:hypothetical protein
MAATSRPELPRFAHRRGSRGVAFLVALGAAAMTWGVESRDPLADDPAG